MVVPWHPPLKIGLIDSVWPLLGGPPSKKFHLARCGPLGVMVARTPKKGPPCHEDHHFSPNFRFDL